MEYDFNHKISLREITQSKAIDQSDEIFLIRTTSKLVIRDEVVSTFIWLPRHGGVHESALAKNQPHTAQTYFDLLT